MRLFALFLREKYDVTWGFLFSCASKNLTTQSVDAFRVKNRLIFRITNTFYVSEKKQTNNTIAKQQAEQYLNYSSNQKAMMEANRMYIELLTEAKKAIRSLVSATSWWRFKKIWCSSKAMARWCEEKWEVGQISNNKWSKFLVWTRLSASECTTWCVMMKFCWKTRATIKISTSCLCHSNVGTRLHWINCTCFCDAIRKIRRFFPQNTNRKMLDDAGDVFCVCVAGEKKKTSLHLKSFFSDGLEKVSKCWSANMHFHLGKFGSQCICRDSNPGRSDGNAAWYPYTTDACYYFVPSRFSLKLCRHAQWACF